jgi:hypothetical protein
MKVNNKQEKEMRRTSKKATARSEKKSSACDNTKRNPYESKTPKMSV